MRVLEVLFGAYRYASIVLTILVINLPLKWAFVASQYYASGPYFLLASLVVVYLRAVPTVRSDSFCLFGSFFLSTKCVLVLALFLSIVFGKTPALVEVLVSGTIAFFIAPRPSNPTPLIQCPSALVDAVISFWQSLGTVPTRERPVYGNETQEEEVVVDNQQVEQLMEMGFERAECEAALKRTLNDVAAAANQLLG